MGDLSTPDSVQKLQTALHAKAKAEPGYRFYALYDKISREDILAHAYAQCRSNKGAPGVDRQDFEAVEAYGVERWLGELALALRQETYRPEPIRRVYIPKANGKLRPLGISTLRDRVCMTAAMLVLEPIFEADLPSELYAYRPGRNAQQAVVEVEELVFRGHREVVDADLADYFGSIPHFDLLKSVARRIVDRRVLHLLRMWLDCPVEETDDRGRKTRTTEARDKRRGIPQGSPISPLLANLYMRRFVLGWKMLGLEQTLGTRLVTYADDLVILCRRGKAEEALQRLREIMGKLKLTVNEDKTRICKVPEGEFDFLGYTFGRMYSARTGRARIGYRPSKKSVQRAVAKVHALTERSCTWQETTKLVGDVNRTLRGWANYFSVGTVSKAYRALDACAAVRLRRWLRFKHKVRRSKGGGYPLSQLYEQFGLVRLTALGHDDPWTKA
ncbi:MAG: group II intron reverse transcriptase/maturase [Verrucomicrobia bacterium]|nr:group II intron reverse transcriptase/maturase [Verrucomicrobiota bacterium]